MGINFRLCSDAISIATCYAQLINYSSVYFWTVRQGKGNGLKTRCWTCLSFVFSERQMTNIVGDMNRRGAAMSQRKLWDVKSGQFIIILKGTQNCVHKPYAQAAQKPPITGNYQSTTSETIFIGNKVRFNNPNTNKPKPNIPNINLQQDNIMIIQDRHF